MTIRKNCRVCGKPIVVANSRYCLCSNPVCKKASQRKQQAERMDIIRSDPAQYERLLKMCRTSRRKRHNGKTICKICGKPIYRDLYNPAHNPRNQMHAECVINGAIEIVKAGQNLSRMWKSRLYAYGYDITTFREMVETGEYY